MWTTQHDNYDHKQIEVDLLHYKKNHFKINKLLQTENIRFKKKIGTDKRTLGQRNNSMLPDKK